MHPLVGQTVLLRRPVVKSPAQIKYVNEKPVQVAAKVEIEEVPATIIGVDPQPNDANDQPQPPNLHLAFLHPDRLAYLASSGWRDAYDRLMGVRHAAHDVVETSKYVAHYEAEFADDLVDKAHSVAQKIANDVKVAAAAAANALAKAEQEKAKAAADAADAKAQAGANTAATPVPATPPVAEPPKAPAKNGK